MPLYTISINDIMIRPNKIGKVMENMLNNVYLSNLNLKINCIESRKVEHFDFKKCFEGIMEYIGSNEERFKEYIRMIEQCLMKNKVDLSCSKIINDFMFEKELKIDIEIALNDIN